ncbi:MAG: DUF3570 domain-containing protein, partial [Myxococcales bacterium]|nr:DUF3570 domain-containing protein [Myxococcales bacterium]
MSQARSLRRSAKRRAAKQNSKAPRTPGDSRVSSKTTGQRRRSLAALTAGALALPGLASPAVADSPNTRPSASYRYSTYQEDGIDSSKLAPGSTDERYEIDTHQLRFSSPVSSRIDFSLDVVHETMSGASPWFVERGPNGEPLQVMSGATIDEERTDFLGKLNFYRDNGRVSILGGISDEKDYQSLNGGLEWERHFNEKNTTLTTGVGLSLDDIEPTDADLFATRVSSEDKKSYSAFLTLSQVLNRHSAIQSTLSYQNSSGFLSDPYKLVSVGGVNVADARPDDRNMISWLTRYRRHFEGLDGSFHADYRFYIDDWDINSHTVEIAWYQNFFRTVKLVPNARYYSQSEEDFYSPFFDLMPTDGYVS